MWHSIINDLAGIFTKVNEDFYQIRQSFKTITLTMNPSVGWQIDSDGKQLTVNIWSMLFTVTKEDKIMFKFPYEIASHIMHEYTHLRSFRELGLNGNHKATPQQDIQIEVDAFTREKEFLEKCNTLFTNQKRYARIIKVIKVDIMQRPSVIIDPIPIGTSDIDGMIEDYNMRIDKYMKEKQDLVDYNRFNNLNDSKYSHIMAYELNLPIETLMKEKVYKTVTLNF